jgi:hypothetical protein
MLTANETKPAGNSWDASPGTEVSALAQHFQSPGVSDSTPEVLDER